MMSALQLSLLLNTNLSLEARTIGLYLSEHNAVEWAELRFPELGTLIARRSPATIRGYVKELVAGGYVDRRPGGRNRGDLFRFHEEHRVGSTPPPIHTIGSHPTPGLNGDRVAGEQRAKASSPHSHLGHQNPDGSDAPPLSRAREEVLTSTPTATSTPPRPSLAGEVLPAEELSPAREELGRPRDFFSPEVGSDHVQSNVILSTWIDRFGLSRQLSAADRGKQAAAAKRLSNRYGAQHLAAAFLGIGQLFPYCNGAPWDLMDLERVFTKALLAAQSHPELARKRRETEIRQEIERDRR